MARRNSKELNASIIDQLEKAFSTGATDLEACCYAGIHLSDLNSYLKTNPEFKQKKEALKQRPLLIARQTLLKGLKEDPKIALEFLDRLSQF